MLDLKTLAFDRGIGQKEIGEIIGVAQSQVSAMMNGKRVIRLEHIARLYEAFGKEVVDSYIREGNPTLPYRTIATIFHADEIEEVKKDIRDEMRNPKREDIETIDAEEVEIKETIIIRSEVLNQEGVDLKKDLKKGILDVEVKPTQDVLPPHQAKVYIGTDEMSPKIEANEPVFVRFLNSTQDFEDGYMYLVDLYHGSFVRWVVREDEEHVRLLSMKSEKVIPLSSVKSFAEVVAITKHPETLPKERITMQEYIVHKDEQLDSLLAQNDKLIDLHGRMMDIIEGQLKK